MFNSDNLNKPITIDGKYYLQAIIDNKTSINIPRSSVNGQTNVRAITYGELVYIALFPKYKRFHGVTTRFPIVGDGSIFPHKYIIKTTLISRQVDLLDEFGNVKYKIYNYPIITETWVNSFNVHYSKMARLDQDNDGDKGSVATLMTEEENL